MIYFLHIHKVAGSTFINMAENNGEILHYPNRNGNPYDQNDNVIPIWNYSYSELKEFITDKPYTFIANETKLKQFHEIEDLKYITIIRHPIDIIMSNYHHIINKKYIELEDYLNINSNYIKNPITHYFSGTDNYQLALERALKFDYILRLDRLEEDINCMRELGWNKLDIYKYRKGTKRNTNSKKEIDKELYEHLEIKMKSDIELYNELYSKIEFGKFAPKKFML